MPNAKDAHDSKTAVHRILALGHTGSGKTTQFLSLPGRKFAYLFDPNAILSLRGQDIEYEEFLPDRINLSAKSLKSGVAGDTVTRHQNETYLNWQKDFEDKLNKGFFDNFDWIAFDSATTFLDLAMDRVLTINSRPGTWPQQDDYGPQMQIFTNVARTLTAMGKGIYMTGHLETKQDKLTGRILQQPMMTGKLVLKIPLLFSDIFICDSDNDGQGKLTYKIQTAPDRMNTSVRSSIKGLKPYEPVTLDFSKPLEGQGLGGLIMKEKR